MDFSILIATDQRLSHNDILPQLNLLKRLNIKGEVLIATNKSFKKLQQCYINKYIKIKLIYLKHFSRAIKRNYLLKLASGKIIILWADDFKLNPSVIKNHLKFHQRNIFIKSICFGMGWINETSLYNLWLEKSGHLFGYPFKKNQKYLMKKYDFFYGGNTSFKKELINISGYYEARCHFDCTDDWIMWNKLKSLNCNFFHVPNCDTEHVHDVTIKERFVALAQSGWNLSNLKYKNFKPTGNLKLKIYKLHQLCSVVSTHANSVNLKKLFMAIEDTAFHIGYNVNARDKNPNKLYVMDNLFQISFKNYGLELPNFSKIERNIKNLNKFEIYKFLICEYITFPIKKLMHLVKYILN
jgi:hypothetical protein